MGGMVESESKISHVEYWDLVGDPQPEDLNSMKENFMTFLLLQKYQIQLYIQV